MAHPQTLLAPSPFSVTVSVTGPSWPSSFPGTETGFEYPVTVTVTLLDDGYLTTTPAYPTTRSSSPLTSPECA